MYPNPYYGWTLPNNTARALVPWAAQGLTLRANQPGIPGIVSLTDVNEGTPKLYGGPNMTLLFAVYNSNVRFLRGGSGGILASSDFTYEGRTYRAGQSSVIPSPYIDFRERSYLGTAGVTDWGVGATTLNGAFAVAAWYDLTVYPFPGSLDSNYTSLLQHQSSSPTYRYLPARNTSGCSGAFAPSGWSWAALDSTCPAGGQSTLVPFFDPFTPPNLAQQVNAHFWHNSFAALHHLVSYFYMSQDYWPRRGDGTSGLPDFGR